MVIFRSMFILMVLAAFLSMGVACSSKEPADQTAGVTEQNQPEAERTEGQPVEATQENQTEIEPNTVADNAPGAEMPKTLELTGTVKQEGDTIMLTTDLGDYIISGQDLSGMVGKPINVTGTVEDVNGQPTINVNSFSEKQE